MRDSFYTQYTNELRQMIMDNPDLPIVVEAETDLCCDDSYSSWIAPTVRFYIGEVLEYDQKICEDRVFFDRVEFMDALTDYYYDDLPTDEKEAEAFIADKLSEYKPYWTKAIIIFAGT